VATNDSVLGGDNSTDAPANAPSKDLHQAIHYLKFGMDDLEAGTFTDSAKAVIAGLQASVMVSPSGLPVQMTNNTTLVLYAGLKIPDATRTSVLSVATDTNISILTTGVNGLDTGAVATNTVYYLWIIRNPTTAQVGGLLSLSATAPTMPSGFTQKQLYPVDFQTETVSGNARLIFKTLISHQKAVLVTPFTFYNAGTPSSNLSAPTIVDLTGLLGTKAVLADFNFWGGTGTGSGQINFYPSGISTLTGGFPNFPTMVGDIERGVGSKEILVDSTRSYKLARQGGLTTYISLVSIAYAPLA
jgi:hypothetical protein